MSEEGQIAEVQPNEEGYKRGRKLVLISATGSALIAVAMINPDLGNEIVRKIADTDPEVALYVMGGVVGAGAVAAVGYGAVEGAKLAGRGIAAGGRAVGRMASETVENVKQIPGALGKIPGAVGRAGVAVGVAAGNVTQEVVATALPVVREARRENSESEQIEIDIPSLEEEVKVLEKYIDAKVAAIGRIDTHISDVINEEYAKKYAKRYGKRYYDNDEVRKAYTEETDGVYFQYRDIWAKLCLNAPAALQEEQVTSTTESGGGKEPVVVEVKELAEAALAVRLLAIQGFKNWKEQVGKDFALNCEKVQYLIVRKVFPRVWEGTVEPYIEGGNEPESDPKKRYRELVNKKNGLLQKKVAYDAIYDNAIEAARQIPSGERIAFGAQTKITFDGDRPEFALRESRSKAEGLMAETQRVQDFVLAVKNPEGIVKKFVEVVIKRGDQERAKEYDDLLISNPREAHKQFMQALVAVDKIRGDLLGKICEDLKIDVEDVKYDRRVYKTRKAAAGSEKEKKTANRIEYSKERLKNILDKFGTRGSDYNAVFYDQVIKGKGVNFGEAVKRFRELAKDKPQEAFEDFMELLDGVDNDQTKRIRDELEKIKTKSK